MTASIAIAILAALGAGSCLRATSHPDDSVTINGKSNLVIEHRKITSTTGDCLVITNATNVTIRASEIGPCKGNAIRISGGGKIFLYDNYIHPEGTASGCCDNHDGVFAKGVTGLTIQGNVVAFGEANIEVQRSTSVVVRGNLLLNPRNGASRGQQFQCSDNCSAVVVENNHMIASLDTAKYKYPAIQEDAINLIGGPTGPTTDVTVKGNYITGGHSKSGCGILTDDGVRGIRILDNIIVDSGQCGIGIANGVEVTVSGNRVRNTKPIPDGGNAGLYVWNQYKSACRDVIVSDNIITSINTSGADSSFWNGGGCEGVVNRGNVTGNRALSLLSRPTHISPPPISPIPHGCAVESPFTAASGKPRCSAGR